MTRRPLPLIIALLVVALLAPSVSAADASPADDSTAGNLAQKKPESRPTSRPASVGKNSPKADALAAAVLKKLGGAEAWEATRFLRWQFFAGPRLHYWDRKTDDVRIEWDQKSGEKVVVLINLQTKKGRAFIADREVEVAAERAKLLDEAYRSWINDSYWLLMPYKLRDPGVSLAHAGSGKMADGREAEMLDLTFAPGAGNTPQNKYRVYVAADTGLIEQWDFYPNAKDRAPQFSTPWSKWKKYGKVQLSSDRGRYRLEKIAVFDSLPRSVFDSPRVVVLDKPNKSKPKEAGKPRQPRSGGVKRPSGK